MSQVPRFLRPEVAATFEHRAVAASYRLRPAFPAQAFEVLTQLMADRDAAVLDLGCGTGFVARPLAPLVGRVDAVDSSIAMIEEGKRQPGGNHPGLRWIVARAEDAELDPPYALATAGDSLHWMDWEVVLPRLATVLTPAGSLAVLSVTGTIVAASSAVEEGVLDLIRQYSTLGEWRPFDLVAELEHRGHFREEGRTITDPVPLHQSVDEYVESFHARASLSWERMAADEVAAFDTALRRLLVAQVGDTVELAVRATVVWGRPIHRTAAV